MRIDCFSYLDRRLIRSAVVHSAMRDQEYKNACAEKVKASRSTLTDSLRKLGFKVGESHGNFVLATPATHSAQQLYLDLKQQGILVRYFNQPRLTDKLRITVGTEAQNQLLLETLRELVGAVQPS